jgi:hypothetical protein
VGKLAISLRVLLALALILNGMESVSAAVTMHPNARVQHTTLTAGVGTKPCHQQQQAGTSTGAGNSMESSLATARHRGPDCCHAGACRCSCNHAGTSNIAAPVKVPVILARQRNTSSLALPHPSPLQPRQIKPPDG